MTKRSDRTVALPETLLKQTMAVVLAGGHGGRLGLLTRNRSKPALPFGGKYRSIDFVLSNCINSGVCRIGVATQYRAQSLLRHIQDTWGFLHRGRSEFVELWPAEQRDEADWYSGTADAVFQNCSAILRHAPQYVLILAADHVYRMDYAKLLLRHAESGADLTIACQPVPAEQACHFGIAAVDKGEVRQFQEKPLGVAGGDDRLASMGVYVFDADLLHSLLYEDAGREDSRHDFGYDLIPHCVRSPGIRVCAYPFRDPCNGGPGYWRDIGTIDAYWAASMELLSGQGFDPGDSRWPIWCAPDRSPPSSIAVQNKIITAEISQSIVAAGCCIEGARVHHSILSDYVHTGAGSVIEDSVILPGARIGENCRVRRAILDENVTMVDGDSLGYGTHDARPEHQVSAGGVTVLSAAGMDAGLSATVRNFGSGRTEVTRLDNQR